MATFNESLTRIRTYLRDPDGNIWTDDDIRRFFNESALEIAQKTGLIEKVAAYDYPPRYHMAYTFDWETQFVAGDARRAFMPWQAWDSVVTHPWEASYWADNSFADDGDRWTMPFEVAYCTAVDVVPVTLGGQCVRVKMLAYARDCLSATTRREVAATDPGYRTRTGEPVSYWRTDEVSNDVVLYPAAAAITFHAEDDELIVGSDSPLSYSEQGIVVSSVGMDNIVVVYEAIPLEVLVYGDGDWDEALEWPPWVVHYVEAGALERAYGADTDGFIPSLRDYWKMRKDTGIMALGVYRRRRGADRDVRIGGALPLRTGRARLSLGSRYPIWA